MFNHYEREIKDNYSEEYKELLNELKELEIINTRSSRGCKFKLPTNVVECKEQIFANIMDKNLMDYHYRIYYLSLKNYYKQELYYIEEILEIIQKIINIVDENINRKFKKKDHIKFKKIVIKIRNEVENRIKYINQKLNLLSRLNKLIVNDLFNKIFDAYY